MNRPARPGTTPSPEPPLAPVTVLLTHPLPFDARRRFPADWCLRVLPGTGPLDRAAALRELPGCQGLLCLLTDAVDRAIIEGGPDRLIIANVGWATQLDGARPGAASPSPTRRASSTRPPPTWPCC